MKRWRDKRPRPAVLLGIFLVVYLLIPEEGFSRRFGGGGFRGGGFSRSRSPSRSNSFRRASRPATFGGARKSSATRKPRSGADRAAYRKAKAAGTTYKSRSQAQKSFMSKHGNEYKSSYASRPAQRPSHIPQTTQVSGQSIPVSYRPQLGGYGYRVPGRGWMMYSVARDAAMMSMLMGRHNYYYGGRPRSNFLGTFMMIGIIGFAGYLLMQRRSGMARA